MSTVPAPPPPPPPIPKFNELTKNVTSISNANKNDLLNDSLCLWATDYPELRRACIRFGISKFSPPYKFSYKKLTSILQEGPTCGLTALTMIINSYCELEEQKVFDMAKEKGYTEFGEMYSCKTMAKLTELMFDLYNIRNGVFLREGELCGEFVVEKLLDENVILVPYDADRNHSPCLNRGYSAHWAVICGVIVPNELHTPADCYVICLQGKSRHLGLWLLSDLEKSNKNLYEYCRNKNWASPGVIPEGGVGGVNGLCNQYILIEQSKAV